MALDRLRDARKINKRAIEYGTRIIIENFIENRNRSEVRYTNPKYETDLSAVSTYWRYVVGHEFDASIQNCTERVTSKSN